MLQERSFTLSISITLLITLFFTIFGCGKKQGSPEGTIKQSLTE